MFSFVCSWVSFLLVWFLVCSFCCSLSQSRKFGRKFSKHFERTEFFTAFAKRTARQDADYPPSSWGFRLRARLRRDKTAFQAADVADGEKLQGHALRFPGRVRERDTNYMSGHESL